MDLKERMATFPHRRPDEDPLLRFFNEQDARMKRKMQMWKQLATGAAMIGLTAALLLGATKARANPPTDWVSALSHPVVVCNDKLQAVSIITEGRKSAEAMTAEYIRFLNMPAVHGDHACAFAEMSAFQAGGNEYMGQSHAANGQLANVWVVHGGTAKAEFWFIWAELVRETPA